MSIIKLYDGENKEEWGWTTEYNTLGTRQNMYNLPVWRNGVPVVLNNENLKRVWIDSVASFTIQPGYEFCGYDEVNRGGWEACFTSNNNNMNNYKNGIASMRLRLDCKYNSHKWDPECNKPSPDSDKYIENCNINSTCYTNQVQECISSDLNTNSNCKNFCTNNSSQCTNSIFNYCNSLDLNTLDTNPICNTIKTDIIKNKCTTNESLFGNNICRRHCTNNSNQCNDVSKKYCLNNMDKIECQEYCTNNIENCEYNIKKYCINDTIISPFCVSVLTTDKMAGKHDIEMEKYCNTSSNKSNDICNCLNKELINKNYETLKEDANKAALIDRPDCFFGKCSSKGNVYRTDEKPCPNLTICQNNIGTLNLTNSCQGLITTNCIKIDNNCSSDTKTDKPISEEPTNEEPTNEEPTNEELTNKEPTNEEPMNILGLKIPNILGLKIPNIVDIQGIMIESKYILMGIIYCICCCCCLCFMMILFF